MPSSADSRVIVPPAPIVRSTVASSVLPSTGRSGIDDARPPVPRCLLGGSGQEHDLASSGEDVLEDRVEPRVAVRVVESSLGRRAHRSRHAVGVETQRYEDGRVRSDVRQVELLLEALVANDLLRRRSESPQARLGKGRRNDHSPGEPEAQVIRRLVLVVHHRHGRHARESRGDDLRVGAVRERHVRTARPGEAPAGRPSERGSRRPSAPARRGSRHRSRRPRATPRRQAGRFERGRGRSARPRLPSPRGRARRGRTSGTCGEFARSIQTLIACSGPARVPRARGRRARSSSGRTGRGSSRTGRAGSSRNRRGLSMRATRSSAVRSARSSASPRQPTAESQVSIACA